MTHPLIFSVVIATHNRPKRLAACLEACAEQDFPREAFEVILVDDGGRVPLNEMVASFRGRLSITLLTEPQRGPGTARNLGAMHARGKYLAFTDDDCAPAPHWLSALAARLQNEPEALLGGRVVNADLDNIYCAAHQAILDMVYAELNASHSPRRYFTTNNVAVPAERFRSLGGFYAHPAEDRDFCDRWLRHGHPMDYANEAVVFHNPMLNSRGFLRTQFHYGRAATHYYRAQSQRTGGGFKIYPQSLLLMFRYPWWQTWQARALPIGALMLLAKAANLAGFLAETGRTLRGQPASPAPLEQRRTPTPGPRVKA